MKFGYYPGCSLHATAREFSESLLELVEALDVQLEEVEDWACCGASSAHATNHLLGVALPARTLAIAEGQGLDNIVAPCAACYGRLAGAAHEVNGDPAL
jgi:heterodisulfide reductase subunit B